MAKMKEYHWQMPAYNLPKDAEHQKMMRVVVREDLSYEMASDLVADMQRTIEYLDHHFIYDGALCSPYKSDCRVQVGCWSSF